jgi:glycosyltransferase involved in cell wall biosynthesis
MNSSRILIGVPAFRGERYIAETLQSIQAQEFDAFRVLIAVDNGDAETAAACQPFLRDARFSLVVHDRQLGWAANINWLMGEAVEEFFCYWQQDDLASPDYLRELMRRADENPSAVCVYSDIQWFGSETSRLICPSVTGFALNRALYFFETMNGTPFRGLIRKSAIESIGPIRDTVWESAFEELVWLAKLAREGKLLRETGPTYFKRKHEDALHFKWFNREPAWKWSVWIEFGIGVLEAIMPVIPESERETALSVILERLCCPRQGRFLLYDPAFEAAKFAAEFLAAARSRTGIAVPDAAQDADQRIIREALTDLPPLTVLPELVADVQDRLRAGSTVKLNMRAGDPSTRLFGHGWSSPESWGTWSDGLSASLRLPLPDTGNVWRVTLEIQAFASTIRPRTVSLRSGGGGTLARWKFHEDRIYHQELLWSAQDGDTIVEFALHDAASPFSLRISNDQRMLGVGMLSLTISPHERRHLVG